MQLKPFKFVVQAVLTEHDDKGAVVGELVAEPVILYGVDGLHQFADEFPTQVETKLRELEQQAEE